MIQAIRKSVFLLLILVTIVCGIYPFALWIIGQVFFPFQANGSLVHGPNHEIWGSRLIAQPFTQPIHFQPRPSAARYQAAASSASSLAPSSDALRNRIAGMIGPVAQYADGTPVAPDIEQWFQQDQFQGSPHIVSQWATLHSALAIAWVKADPLHAAYIEAWSRAHPAIVRQFVMDHPELSQPAAADLAVTFFQHFSLEYPGKFPSTVTITPSDGKPLSHLAPVSTGREIQAVFFDMWRTDHPDTSLREIPGDYVTTSASGLDPDITVQNARFQLEGVASAWARRLHRDPAEVKSEIEALIESEAHAPLWGLAGESSVNVLELNLALHKKYDVPRGE